MTLPPTKLSGTFLRSGSVPPVVLGGGVVSSSGQVTNLIPTGTVSSSAQIDYNSIQNKLSGVVSSSTQVQPLLPGGTISSSAQYPGWVTASSQIDYNSITNKLSGVYSSSTQAVAAIAGQTIAPSVINATGAISGASIQTSGNGTVGGNLTVTGLLTATSQSIQYVSSSQFNVSTNKILVNTNQSLQFGGLSVIDSGSSNNSGSLYWDSVNNRWLYEEVTGAAYTSAILINGPINTGATGTERGLVVGRVPVATGDDHIDTAAASSSIRVDYTNTKRVDIEAGLFVTGALTANGTVTLAGIPSSSGQIQTLLPGSTVSSSAQVTAFLPASTISSSTQFKTLTDPFTGSFTGSFNGAHTGSILAAGVVSSSAQYPGWMTSSTQVVWSSVNYNTGIVSSSGQVQLLLPGSTVSSSAQYPGWMTSSAQVVWSSVNYSAGIVSSSAQFNALTGTSASYAATSSNLNGGTANYIPLWSSATAQSASSMYQLTGNIGINNTVPSASLHISGSTMIQQVVEKIAFTGSAPIATTNIDITSGSIHYRSGSTSTNWTLNFRGDASTTLNSIIYPNQSLTVAVVVNHGATPYSASAHQIDGKAVTPRWQGSLVPTASANTTDFYSYTIFKLASASYDVFASQVKFS